jgi:hypothetical protein
MHDAKVKHNQTIIEQFAKQAVAFAEMPGHSDKGPKFILPTPFWWPSARNLLDPLVQRTHGKGHAGELHGSPEFTDWVNRYRK